MTLLDLETVLIQSVLREYLPLIQEEAFYQPRFTYMEYGVGQRTNVYAAEEISARLERDNETSVETFSGQKKVKIEPVRENGEPCKVQMKYTVLMPDQYADITNFAGATIGPKIIVEQKPDTIEVVAAREPGIHHEPRSNSWYFDRAYVPGQHLRLWWFKRPTSQTSAQAT